MHYEGTFQLKAPIDKVWSFLTIPENIAKCIPDLQKFEVLGEDKFRAQVKVGIGFIKGSMTFDFAMTEKDAPKYAKLVGHGSGTGSTVDLETAMNLESTPDGGTNLAWKADAKIGGLLAGVGQRLIGGAAEKVITKLFDGIKKAIE